MPEHERDRRKNDTSLEGIAERLRVSRAAFAMSQVEFAERAGISQNAYNQYEHAKRRLSLEAAYALCDTYDLTLDWIYRGRTEGLPHQLALDFQKGAS